MTLQELRQRWREIKDRPKDDQERQEVEAAMFYAFHQACQRQERQREVVFDTNIDLNQAQQGRGNQRR